MPKNPEERGNLNIQIRNNVKARYRAALIIKYNGEPSIEKRNEEIEKLLEEFSAKYLPRQKVG